MKSMKIVSMAAILLMTGLAQAEITTVWNPAANGIYPPDAGSWSDGANWTGGTVPDGDYKTVFNVGGAAECVLSDTRTVKHIAAGDGGDGGVLRLASGANLTSTSWSAAGVNNNAHMIIEHGAVANFQEHLFIGMWDDGAHNMNFTMNGGTVTIGDAFTTGLYFDNNPMTVNAHIQMNDGTVTANWLGLNWGTCDITGGTVVLRTDQRGAIQGYINSGVLTGYGDSANVVMTWDEVAGTTTITAIPEPTTLLLLGLGGLVIRRRSR